MKKADPAAEAKAKMRSQAPQTMQQREQAVRDKYIKKPEQSLEDKVRDKYGLKKKLNKSGESTKKPGYGTNPETERAVLEKYKSRLPKILEHAQKLFKDKKIDSASKRKMVDNAKAYVKYLEKGVAKAEKVHAIRTETDQSKLPIPHFSEGNSKLNKDGIISFSLPAGHSCPGKGECFNYCYARGGRQQFNNVQSNYDNNWGLSERDDFVEVMNNALRAYPTTKKITGMPAEWMDKIHPDRKKNIINSQQYTDKKDGKEKIKMTTRMGDVVRVHDSGDFHSQDYADKWHQIAKSNPDKHFYAYTKANHLNLDHIHSLPNFTLIHSVGSNADEKIDPSKPHAKIYPDMESLKADGAVHADDSDYTAAMIHKSKKPTVGLVVHGAKKGAFDETAHGAKLKKSQGSYHLVGDQIPEPYLWDQWDHAHQLEHSNDFLDMLELKRVKEHVAEHMGSAPLQKATPRLPNVINYSELKDPQEGVPAWKKKKEDRRMAGKTELKTKRIKPNTTFAKSGKTDYVILD